MPSVLQKSQATKRGKKYREKASLVQKSTYAIPEAVELLIKVNTVAFDATAEVHIRINANPTQADQIVRTVVDLPHGTGKTPRIAAFVPDDLIETAKKAGALKAGNADLIHEVEEGTIDFDVAVAVPKIMKDLGKVAKTLGQRGLMPNPKAGTVTDNVAKTIEALRKGRTECKMDTFGIIHTIFGKISFGKEKLQENLQTLLQAIDEARPAGIRDPYIRSITITPTMGPGIHIAL